MNTEKKNFLWKAVNFSWKTTIHNIIDQVEASPTPCFLDFSCTSKHFHLSLNPKIQPFPPLTRFINKSFSSLFSNFMKNNFHLRWCFLCLQGKKCAVKYFSPKLLCRWKTFFLIIFPGHKAHWTINGLSFCFPRWYVTSFMSFNEIFVVKKTRHSSQVSLRHWKKFSSNGLFMVID